MKSQRFILDFFVVVLGFITHFSVNYQLDTFQYPRTVGTGETQQALIAPRRFSPAPRKVSLLEYKSHFDSKITESVSLQ